MRTGRLHRFVIRHSAVQSVKVCQVSSCQLSRLIRKTHQFKARSASAAPPPLYDSFRRIVVARRLDKGRMLAAIVSWCFQESDEQTQVHIMELAATGSHTHVHGSLWR